MTEYISFIGELFHFLIKLCAAFVLGALADSLVDSALFAPVDCIVVEASVDVVEVVEAFDFVDSSAGQFHQGEVHHHIVGTGVEFALIVLEVFFLYLQEQFCPIGPQVGKPLGSLPVVSVFFVTVSVLRSEAQHDVPALVVPEEVGVEHS